MRCEILNNSLTGCHYCEHNKNYQVFKSETQSGSVTHELGSLLGTDILRRRADQTHDSIISGIFEQAVCKLSPVYKQTGHRKVVPEYPYSNMEALSIGCHVLKRIFSTAIASAKECSYN